ncbi:acyl-CoA reductase-like NAD-dependent aldehyde dehydrogenase [Paraburkholderia sp. JPY681]|nr:acyl-CoA reductase-like NAD-dependent aldehyde dehydrogenase [Paraburkholderia atlantica]
MSGETGKPLLEARGEINASADQFEWYAEEAKRIYGHTIAGRHADERLAVGYQPVGPCLALSAWNFPMLLPSRKIAAALAAGCSVMARPASEAPGSCMALGQVLLDAGLPAGVLGILTGHAKPMVARLVQSKVICKVSLTGSVPVGKEILRLAADHVKKVTMELGGHAPVIVHADVDDVTDAITRANATGFGLAAYVFTHDSARAAMTAEALEAGMVGINETLLATAEAPFGGIKESGFGREGGSLGILDYLTPKYIRHRLIVRNGT